MSQDRTRRPGDSLTGRFRLSITICVVALAAACAASTPATTPEHQAAPEPTGVPPVAVEHDVEPELTNRDELLRLMQESLPRNLKEPGFEGKAGLWVFVNRAGSVTDTRFDQRSGYPEFDELALELAAEMHFTPAERSGQPIGVWTYMPFTFATSRSNKR